MEITKLTKNDIGPAAEVAARAFGDDAFFRYWFPEDRRRYDCIKNVFRLLLIQGLREGEAFITAPRPAGFSVWVPIAQADMSLWSIIRYGALPLLAKIGIKNLIRLQELDEISGNLRRNHASKNSWFLAGLGVDPDCQKQGYGTSLLLPMLRRLDAAGLDCYLDTQKRENITYYRRFGFEVIGEVTHGPENITIWGMMRPPRQQPPASGPS